MKTLIITKFISNYLQLAILGILLSTASNVAISSEDQVLQFDEIRWKKLMSLIDSEIKTIKGNKYSGAEIKHRLFELYSEKLKLIKEKENMILVKTPPEVVQKKGKDFFLKTSGKQYKTAQKFALSIIKQYPQYKKASEIYYAMAINSRDYGTSEETEKYLKQALKFNLVDAKTKYNAETALAEYYYNNKRYHEAVNLYQSVLKNNQNEWYGKHLYNASWCHLKERNFKKALELIKLSYEVTKENKYVSMEEQVISAIGIFFVQADATIEGIDFFEKNTTPSSPHLLRLAQSSMSKNNFQITEEVLKHALNDTKKRKNINDEFKIRLGQLDIYRENKKDDHFLETANSILALYQKGPLDQNDVFMALNKIKEVAGFMQINLIKDKTKETVEFEQENYKKIVRYFDILCVLDSKNKGLYRYYQGETALSTHNFKMALNYYKKSVLNTKKLIRSAQFQLEEKTKESLKNKTVAPDIAEHEKLENDKKSLAKKSLEAMISTIELAQVEKDGDNKYTIFAFKNYVIIFPKSDKSQTIYQKLFSHYFQKIKLKNAINVLTVYEYHYPKDEVIHREMVTQILDHYIKQKNTDKLALWITKIEKGYLNFQSEYIEKSIAILGELLFKKYQALERSGQTKEAMVGYESIYLSKKYPKRTKAEAAYAISTLLLEQNKSKSSYEWLNNSFELYDSKEIIKMTSNIYVLANGHRLLQNINVSTKISETILDRFCHLDFEKKSDFYRIINQNYILTHSNLNDLHSVEDKYKNCNLDTNTLTETREENILKLVQLNQAKSLVSYINKFEIDNLTTSKSIIKKYLEVKFSQSPTETMAELRFDSSDLNQFLSELDTNRKNIISFINGIQNLEFNFTNEDKFNEEKYNNELENYFSTITKINNDTVVISKNSSVEEVIMLRDALSLPYKKLINAVNSYNPNGVESNYLEGFKASMRQITEALATKSLQVDKEKTAFLQKNDYFFEIKKNDIVGSEKTNLNLEKLLSGHFSILFSNTLDIGVEKNQKVAQSK